MLLKLIDGAEVDLSVSVKFTEFAKRTYSKTELIVNQFNSGKFPEIPEGRTFLDIGGNIGLFSIFVSPFYDKVVMLEPTPEHLVIAHDLVEKLGLEDKIDIIPRAYWSTNTVLDFNIGRSNSTMNSFVPQSLVHQECIKVSTINLDQLFFDFPEIDFIKMDIEGGEMLTYRHKDFENITRAKRVLIEAHCMETLALNDIIENAVTLQDHLEGLGMETISLEIDELYMKNGNN